MNCVTRYFSVALCAAFLTLVGAKDVGAQSSLQTTLAGGQITIGSMFTVRALQNISIESFDVRFGLISTGLPTTVEVWALNNTGAYTIADQTSMTNWTQLATVPVGIPTTPHPLSLNLGFLVPSGVTQSFYITLGNSGLRLEDTPGTSVGSVFASNSDLEINEGNNGTDFNATMGPAVWNGVVRYNVLPTVSDDIGIESVVLPTSGAIDCAPATAAEAVTVNMRNFGMNPIPSGTLLTMTYQVDANPVVTEFATTGAALNPGDTFTYIFATTADLSAIGSYNVTGTVNYGIDLEPTNDSLTTQVGSGGELRVSTFPYSEDFDLGGGLPTTETPLGFINLETDSTGSFSDWILRSDATPTVGVGPAADNTTGIPGQGGYAYVDGDGFLNDVSLRTPCFDLSGLVNPRLRFFLHSSNVNAGAGNPLAIDVISYPSGTVTPNVVTPFGSGPNAWVRQNVDLSPFIGSVVQVVFRAGTTTAGNAHDICIDDVSLTDLMATPGQAPQPGLAVLDLNNPANINGDILAFGLGGPYFTSVAEGDILQFNISGTPLQSINLLGGALNPVAANFPGIGSLDLGGPVDPMTGIPTGISVLANGDIPTGLDGFFRTAADGLFEFGITVPAFPPNVQITFQAAISASAGVSIKLTNAVEVTFL